MQAGMYPILNHACTKFARRFLRHYPIKDQLYAVRPAQIQVVANDLLEELAPFQGPVKDLRQADLRLPDRQIPVVARFPVLRAQRQWNSLQPFAEDPVDVLWSQGIADLLELV